MVRPDHSLVTTPTELTRLGIYVQVNCCPSFEFPTKLLYPFLVYALRDVIDLMNLTTLAKFGEVYKS